MVPVVLTAGLAAGLLGCGSSPGDEPSATAELSDGRPYFDHSELPVTFLTGEVLTDPPIIGRPGTIRMAGRWLWVHDRAGDPWLHLVNPETGDLRSSVGRRGEGPTEFLHIGNMGAVGLDGDTVWVWDSRLQRLSFLAPQASGGIKHNSIAFRSAVPVARLVRLEHDRIVGISYSDSIYFSLFNSHGEGHDGRARPLLGSEGIPVQARRSASGTINHLCKRLEEPGFAIAYGNAGRVELYGRDARLSGLFDVPYASQPVFEPDPTTSELRHRTVRAWYMDCVSTEHHFVALFSGRLYREYETEFVAGEFLHVFGWDGGLETVIRLDRPVTSVALDPDGGAVYAVSSLDTGIYRFPLTSELANLLRGSD